MNEEIIGELQKSIITVEDLLTYNGVTLPLYQRPYKWTTINVFQLLEDVYHFRKKNEYRLGTIVMHLDKDGCYNIVDGQQRTITLLLIAKAIISNKANYKNPILLKKLSDLSGRLISFEFNSNISKANIQLNYQEVRRAISRFNEENIFFLLENCKLVLFILTDITEAFQFFDAQNARGKDLDPHDLLKAFHLREFSEQDISVQSVIVDKWEKTQSTVLATLFSDYLFRIKGWTKANSSRFFGKNDINMFKGIKVEQIESYPYTAPLKIAHYFTDDYNNHLDRKIDNNRREYPFQIDDYIINGKRFFEYVNYYKGIIDSLYNKNLNQIPLEDKAKQILTTLDTYPSRNREGDKHARALFDCAMIFYIDKFKYFEISRIIEKVFIWAYGLRLRFKNLQFATVDNYVVDELNLFKIISDSTTPKNILNINLKNIEVINGTKIQQLITLFTELNYYES